MNFNMKQQLDIVIKNYEIVPVGNGYIDLITRREFILQFINALNNLNIKIAAVSWFDFVDYKREAWGLGGPKNPYGEGWFSEICSDDAYFSTTLLDNVIENNNQYLKYIFEDAKKQMKHFYNSFVPSFCLEVPKEWIII